MNNKLCALILSVVLCSEGFAQGNPGAFPNYGFGVDHFASSPGAYNGAAGGSWNPALWSAMQEFEFAFGWNDAQVTPTRIDDWGVFAGGDGVGFSMHRSNFLTADGADRVDDYSLGFGDGDREYHWGVSYNWSRGNSEALGRDHYVTLGSLYRPFRYLSLGGATSYALDGGDYRAVGDVGVRPFGRDIVTLFGDFAAGRKDNPTSMQWGAGAEVQPFDGLRVAAKWTKPYPDSQDKIYSIGFGISMSGIGFHAVPHYDKDSERTTTSYLVRLGSQERAFNIEKYVAKDDRVVMLGMKGVLTYQKEKIGAAYKIPLWRTLTRLDKVQHDPTIAAVAVNLSGFSGSRAMTWELREKLAEIKSSGKQVYVYADNLGMTSYYFASVADKLILDPQGMIIVPGFVAGRTFWKGFFEKIGVGVEELRYFTYKSAFESFARRDMSAPDKEQRLALISDMYETWVSDIASSRNLSSEAVRSAVDSMAMYDAKSALASGLVDTLARWSDIQELIKTWSGEDPDFVTVKDLDKVEFADQGWGRPPEIAVVYALGECAMDSGIRGRYTSRLLRKLSKDKHTKAVVLRADSPGGDGLASDYVAAEMKTVSGQKPMVVSQGGVAASGGYWISMYGDRIFTSPFTVTGSIGVIAGWLWNDGFSAKTGFTSDHVQVGRHADVEFGVRIPFIDATLPDRTFSDEERATVERLIRAMYDEFTEKVADGRELEKTQVDSIGQGRAWSGPRALDLALVDEIGGMEKAIGYSKEQAKLSRDSRTKIVEYPKPSWLNPDLFSSSSPSPLHAIARVLFGTPVPETGDGGYELAVMKRLSKSPGRGYYLTPPEDVPAEEAELPVSW